MQEDDIIEEVGVTDKEGHVIHYVTSPKTGSAAGDITEKPLDPVRLPFELQQWAASLGANAQKTVTLVLLRKNPPPEAGNNRNHREDDKVKPELEWQDGWQFNNEKPGTLSSPLAIPGLGIAYRVETTVQDVEPGSPADKAGIQKGDVIKQCNFFAGGKKVEDKPEAGKLAIGASRADYGAIIFENLQGQDFKEMTWTAEARQEASRSR